MGFTTNSNMRKANLKQPPSHEKMMEDFERLYKEFWRNPNAQAELDAYVSGNNDYDYLVLKGLIPKPLLGKVTTGMGQPWQRSDTFFTDYQQHYPEERVLSETKDSLIICNNAAHDTRLYESSIDPSKTDKTAVAGMSYMHLLVVPKAKVYNVVSLKDASIIDEMIDHFHLFWAREDAADKVNAAVADAMERRITDLEKAYESIPPPSSPTSPTVSQQQQQQQPPAAVPLDPANLKATIDVVRQSARALGNELLRLRHQNREIPVEFGFHVHPHASVGHLHMHVILRAPRFKEFSTRAHDWKTLSAHSVKTVLLSLQKPEASKLQKHHTP